MICFYIPISSFKDYVIGTHPSISPPNQQADDQRYAYLLNKSTWVNQDNISSNTSSTKLVHKESEI